MKQLITKWFSILPTSLRAILCFHAHEVASYRLITKKVLLDLKIVRHHRSFNSARRRADAACNSSSSSRGPFRAPIGSLESTRSRAARGRGPFLRTPLSSRVGTAPPVLSFTSAVFVCGIPRSEYVICRVPLFHRHDHTPHYDSAIRQPALFLPQVAGAA